MKMLQLQQLRREREQWHARAREFQALAMAARREFDNDDVVWFEQAYEQAREKYAQACRAMEQNTVTDARAT